LEQKKNRPGALGSGAGFGKHGLIKNHPQCWTWPTLIDSGTANMVTKVGKVSGQGDGVRTRRWTPLLFFVGRVYLEEHGDLNQTWSDETETKCFEVHFEYVPRPENIFFAVNVDFYSFVSHDPVPFLMLLMNEQLQK
jgi:hypothetical protein